MPEKKLRQELGLPRQVRFPVNDEKEIQTIADMNGIEFVAAVRMAARFGLPELRRRLGTAVKQAA